MDTAAAVGLIEKLVTLWGPLALGWIGFFVLLIRLLREGGRREEAALRALNESTKTLGDLERTLDKVLQIRQ